MTISDAVIEPERVEVESHSSAPDPLAQPATHVSTDAGDLIRPLTLTPSVGFQPQTYLQTAPQQPSNPVSNAVSAGSDSSAAIGAVAAPVIIPLPAPDTKATAGLPQPLLGVVSPRVDHSGVPMPLATGSPNVAHVHPGKALGGTSQTPGGLRLGTGYAATGGGSRTQVHQLGLASGVRPDVSSNSSSNTANWVTANSSSFISGPHLCVPSLVAAAASSNADASGTLSGSTDSYVQSSGSRTGFHNTDAKWSIAGVGSGTLQIDHDEGDNVIGGEVGYSLRVTGGGHPQSGGGGGAATIVPNSVSWTIQAPGFAYNIGQSPPNPSQGQNQWNSSYYTTYDYGSQHGTAIIFCWGFLTGDVTLEAYATVQVIKNNVPYSTSVTAYATATVGAPGWQAHVVTQKSESYVAGVLMYARGTEDEAGDIDPNPPGISWDLTTTDPGTPVPTGFGSLEVVQILTSYDTSISIPAGDEQGVFTGMFHDEKQPDGSVKTSPKLTPPGLDGPPNMTNSFYPATSPGSSKDSPYLSHPMTDAPTLSDSSGFMDYVMFQPPQGLWVPMGYFAWHYSATAMPNPSGPKPYKLIPQGSGLDLRPTMSHANWPGSWNFVVNAWPPQLKKQQS